MGLLSWLFAPPPPAALDAAINGPAFAVDETSIDPAVFGLTAYSTPTASVARVDRKAAMQVPAVKRVRDLIAGSLGQLPVELYDGNRAKVAATLFDQPERDVPRSVTMTRLVEDMLLEGSAWWHVVETINAWPSRVKRMVPRDVALDENAKRCPDGLATCSGAVTYKGKHLHDADVIRFESPNDALLVAGARAIRSCIALDSAAYRYADGAPPLDYFTPEGGMTLDDDEIVAMLNNWGDARAARSTAYVPASLKYNVAGWNPEQLQLADARDHAVLEIARLGGVDPEELGVSTTSRTYTNQFDRRKAFTDFTLGSYMTAIQDRLNMGDVTPAGHYARFNLSAFLRSDDKTRYETYKIGREVGALDEQDIREAEQKPPIRQERTVPALTATPAATFDDATPELRLDAPGAQAFNIDPVKRTISGLLVPYGVPARSNGQLWQFSQGTLRYAAVSRVKLWIQHDRNKAVGVATELDDREDGMYGTFRVARGAAGDEALSYAEDGVLDGFSIGLAQGGRFRREGNVNHAIEAPLMETSLTPAPSFDDARVHAVAAQADTEGEAPMSDTVTELEAVAFDATPITDAIREGFAGLATPQAPARETISPAATGFSVTEELPYRFDGIPGAHGFVQDIRDAYASGNPEAHQRLDTFLDEAFAVTTANVAALNPTQNRPELYVPNLTYTTPLFDLVSKGSITDQTPFTVPKFASASGLVGNHSQGVEPTPGAFTATPQNITPAPLSGKIEILREVWDQGGSPQADGIIWAEMLNAWYEAREAQIAAALAAIGTAELNLASAVNGALDTALTGYFAGLQFVRGGNRFTATAADSKLFLALIGAVDTAGRKLFPVINPSNATGTTTGAFDSVQVGAQAVRASWALAQGTNTKSYNFVPSSVWCWTSAPKRFTFEYQVKSIDMAIWGYAATAILRDSDVKPIDYDVADA